LAYAQTHFPNSKTTVYLNGIVLQLHQQVHVPAKYSFKTILDFFKKEYPLIIYQNRKSLFYAFLITGLAVLLGAFSAANDAEYVRLIMGDAYVNMTLENIDNGTPLGVYDNMEPLPMFFRITLNNIRVALMAFGFGALLSLGTGIVLLQNGVMLGAFQYFFFKHNFLWESMAGIWMHGTIEIFSIVIAGGAGLVMGNSLLFPGTLPRLVSFQKGAMKGIKIVIGLIPFFVIAGFIESWLTRHSTVNRLSIITITLSLLILLLYFFIYPIIQNKQHEASI
jgi:uncharacterized membrane protein SpoIIM required for sporulation